MNTKSKLSKIGIWMDHSEAKFIEPSKELSAIHTTRSKESGLKRQEGESAVGVKIGTHRSTNNEFSKHRKEENNIREYFEALVGKLNTFDEIFIFGPTTAASEFKNYIENEKVLQAKKLHFGKSDYITEPQMLKAVKEYFDAIKSE